MIWHSWAQFFAMGGYGLYVWGAFGMTGFTVLLELLQLRARRRTLRAGEAHEGT